MQYQDLEIIDFSHCLRAETTKYIICQILVDRCSINIVGRKGTGKTRLIQDIQKFEFANAKTIFVDLKNYTHNYDGLITTIKEVLVLQKEIRNISQIFDEVDTNIYYILFLDNYDALLEEIDLDNKYDEQFYNELNYIRNKSNISLVCTTKIPHNNMLVYIGGVKTNRNSWLHLSVYDLQELSYKEIEHEFKRKDIYNNNLKLIASNNGFDYILKAVCKKNGRYSLLCFYAEQLNSQHLNDNFCIKKLIRKWNGLYRKQQKRTLDKLIFMISDRLKRIYKVANLDKLKSPVINFIAKIINLIRK